MASSSGIIDLVMGAAYFITPVILAGVGGWRNTMYIWGGIALLVAVLWMILGRERATPAYQERLLSQERTPLAVMLKYPQLWVMGLGMAGAMLSFQAFSTFWPTFAGEELGVSLSTAGFVLGFMSIAAAPMDVLVNVVPSFVRRQTAVIGLSGLVTAGCLVGLLYISSTPLVILLGVVKGAAMAYFPVLMVMVYQLPGIKPREVAMGLAFMSTSIWVGSALGPLLVGFLEEATGDLQLSLLITAFFPLTLVVSALVLQGRRWQMVGQVPVSANPGHET